MVAEDFKCASEEDICELFFNGLTKPKFLYEFDEVTPKGNRITGYINQKPNRYLGSMVILSVNGEAVEQFIQSMPKIHYHKDERDISKTGKSNCYEKLDGSCLIIYPLKNHNGDMIELVPKTRGRPVADPHFIELLDKVDKKPIYDYYAENDGNLIFELYGILNQHDIIHYTTGIDLAFIGAYENGEHITGYGEHINGFTNNPRLAEIYGFKLPDKLCEIQYIEDKDYWIIHFTSNKYKGYLPYNPVKCESNTEAVKKLKEVLEKLNKDFYNINKRLATEGVVINTIRDDASKKWLKCKPREIEEKHRTVDGIPVRSIKKECYKYFDEYGSEVKEIYNTDPKHHTEYLKRMLKEEYNEELVNRSKNKIERVFMQVWESKEVPESIHNICQELYDEYHEEGISHCMRMFAEEYPMKKKKDARLVYSVLEKLFLKNEERL